MDFDTELLKIQGALMHANSVYPFPKLTSWGGKEAEMKKVIEVLKSTLPAVTENGNSKTNRNSYHRKVNLFIILNSDLSIVNKLSDSDDLGHIVWVVPTIPKCLLVHLIWDLNLEQFYFEAMQYGSPELSMDLLNAARLHLKYVDPDKILSSARFLVFSMYTALFNIKQNKMVLIKDNSDAILNKLSEILKYFREYDKPIIKRREKNEFYLHTGKALSNLFQLMISCFDLFLKPVNNVLTDFEIYKYTYVDDVDSKVDVSEKIKEEIIGGIHGMLMNVAEEAVMVVDVDMFCTWCEHDDEADSNKTFQTTVGELAFQLKNIIESDERLENQKLTLILQEISIKPVDVGDVIKDASRDEILKNSLISNDDQKLWLAAMIRKNHFFFDEECVQCALKLISLFVTEDCKFMFKNAVSVLEGNVEIDSVNGIKSLAIASFHALCPDDQVVMISDTYSKRPLSDLLELPDFGLKLTEFLNKLIEISAKNFSDIYIFFIQNTEKFFKQMFSKCVHNNCETDTIFDALKCLKLFFKLTFDCSLKKKGSDGKQNLIDISMVIFNCFNEILDDFLISDVLSSNHVYFYFVESLVKNEFINDEALLTKSLMPKLHAKLKERKLVSLKLLVNTLRSVCLVKIPKRALMAPLIAMLAQIMEVMRPALNTFNRICIDISEDLETLVTSLLAVFLKTTKPSDKEYNWLLDRISLLSPINGYYFQNLRQPKQHVEYFDSGLTEKDAALCLCYLLPRSTSTEWDMIFTSLLKAHTCDDAFKLLCETIKAIAEAAQDMKSEASTACVNYCVINTAGILQGKVLQQEAVTLSAITDVVTVINSMSVENESTIMDYVLLPLRHAINKYVGGRKIEDCHDYKCDLKKVIISINNENFKTSLEELLKRSNLLD